MKELSFIIHPAKKIKYEGQDNPYDEVIMFAETKSGEYKYEDVFSGINLSYYEKTKDGKFTGYGNSIFEKKDTIGGSPNVADFLQKVYPEATSYFRDIEEVIDGEKCYNVGKLRKIYENLDPRYMVDYDKLLNMDTSKFFPLGKNNDNDKVLFAVEKPKSKVETHVTEL